MSLTPAVFAADPAGALQISAGRERKKVSPGQCKFAADFFAAPAEALETGAGSRRQVRAVDSAISFFEKSEISGIKLISIPNIQGKFCEKIFCDLLARSKSVYIPQNREDSEENSRSATISRFSAVMSLGCEYAVVGIPGNFQEILELVEISEKFIVESGYPWALADSGKLADLKFPGFPGTGGILNLREEKYFADFAPLAEENKFPGYVKESGLHSRSYCHHLLCREELVGFQILAALNLANYDRFFREIRAALDAGNFKSWKAEFLEKNFQVYEGPEIKRVRKN